MGFFTIGGGLLHTLLLEPVSMLLEVPKFSTPFFPPRKPTKVFFPAILKASPTFPPPISPEPFLLMPPYTPAHSREILCPRLALEEIKCRQAGFVPATVLCLPLPWAPHQRIPHLPTCLTGPFFYDSEGAPGSGRAGGSPVGSC